MTLETEPIFYKDPLATIKRNSSFISKFQRLPAIEDLVRELADEANNKAGTEVELSILKPGTNTKSELTPSDKIEMGKAIFQGFKLTETGWEVDLTLTPENIQCSVPVEIFHVENLTTPNIVK